ncbi:MAG: hypothetical protein IKE41_02815, partial [Clostridia bacterium]|nr:hypothetical protein [Clostridia bacterium]MBR2734971.1 hypothetical protein [Clostridia bacterium]
DEPALVKLITVHNSYELGVTESILKDNKIPYIVRESGAGGFLKITTGALLTDADIMIERSYLDKAKDLTYMLNSGEHAEHQNG